MRRTIVLSIILAAGFAAAIALTVAPRAFAYDIHSLPAGYTTDHIVSTSSVCPDSYYIFGYSSTSPQLCTDSPTFQQDIDAFVDATCPAAVCHPVTTTAAPPETTAPPVVTDTTVTSTPAPTVTDTTTSTPAPPTVTVTNVVQTTLVDPTIDQRLSDLEAHYAALAARVDAIAKANTASWDAFIGVIGSGGSVADAALAARSAGLNAIYQL